MKSINPTYYILSFILLLSSSFTFAQNAEKFVVSGDVAHLNYSFDDAVEAYFEALSIMERDSADTSGIQILKEKLLLSENGRNMRKQDFKNTHITTPSPAFPQKIAFFAKHHPENTKKHPKNHGRPIFRHFRFNKNGKKNKV